MTPEAAKAIIKHYVQNHFDDRWHPEPLFLAEYSHFYEFGINSKQYAASRDFQHLFVGLGPSYISKTHGDIVQYGSAYGSITTQRDFLKTEHKLNRVRTHYSIERADYSYNTRIQNITDPAKASTYITGIQPYAQHVSVAERLHLKIIDLPALNYFGLLNLLYFNVIDPFCDISFEKQLLMGHDDVQWGRAFKSFNDLDAEDLLFEHYMLDTIKRLHPDFTLDACYQAQISKLYEQQLFMQYAPIAGFSYYGYDAPTGIEGYLWYDAQEIDAKLKADDLRFEYVQGKELLFFLFVNAMHSFCDITLKALPHETSDGNS